MKKKNIITLLVLAVVIIAILLTIYFLRDKNSNLVKKSDTDQSSTENIGENDTHKSDLVEETADIITETYSQENIQIEYPQITGLTDKSKENTINELIKNNILTDENTVNPELIMSLTYEVKMNTDELLSIIYTGKAKMEGGAFPTNEIYSITIDLKNMTELKLSDFTAIDDELVQKIRQSTEITNASVKNGMMDKQDLIEAVGIQLDTIISQGSPMDIYISNDTFYVTQDSLGVKLSIAHASGDYALVKIPR